MEQLARSRTLYVEEILKDEHGELTELDDVEARIRSVTASDVQRVARRYFDPARRVEAIVRGGAPTTGPVTP